VLTFRAVGLHVLDRENLCPDKALFDVAVDGSCLAGICDQYSFLGENKKRCTYRLHGGGANRNRPRADLFLSGRVVGLETEKAIAQGGDS